MKERKNEEKRRRKKEGKKRKQKEEKNEKGKRKEKEEEKRRKTGKIRRRKEGGKRKEEWSGGKRKKKKKEKRRKKKKGKKKKEKEQKKKEEEKKRSGWGGQEGEKSPQQKETSPARAVLARPVPGPQPLPFALRARRPLPEPRSGGAGGAGGGGEAPLTLSPCRGGWLPGLFGGWGTWERRGLPALGGAGCCRNAWLLWWIVWCCATLLCPAPSVHQPCRSLCPLSPPPPWQTELEGVMLPLPASPHPKPVSAIRLGGSWAPVSGEAWCLRHQLNIQRGECGFKAGKREAERSRGLWTHWVGVSTCPPEYT